MFVSFAGAWLRSAKTISMRLFTLYRPKTVSIVVFSIVLVGADSRGVGENELRRAACRPKSGEACMSMMSMRLNGSAEAIDAMLDVLRGSPGVDRVVEMGTADVPQMPE